MNFQLFFGEVIQSHTDVYFVLSSHETSFLYSNQAIQKTLGWEASDLVARAVSFDQLMVRSKRWKILRKEIESHSERGEFYIFVEELRSPSDEAISCNLRMKKVHFEGQDYFFGQIILVASCGGQNAKDSTNALMLRNASLMRDVTFNKYVYDLILKIQTTGNIDDIISAVCRRLVERDKSEFSIELVQLYVLRSDHMSLEYSTAEESAAAKDISFLNRIENFVKTATSGDVLRDNNGGIALAINLFDVDHLDGVMVLKAHSEEQLVKELSELKVIVTSMARQINTVHLTERLRKESIEDPLTGVFNRRYFDKSIRDEVNRADRHRRYLSLIFIDIDFFKKVNDFYGHTQGDSCLKEVARLVNETGRASDQVFRYGGEEFVVLLPETNFQQAMVRAEKIRKMIEEKPFENINEKEKPLKVTVSLGVAEYKSGISIETFVSGADDALYRAKAAGRNRAIGAEF